jgi:tetratricopeptide (TPR) repeat protein
MCRVAVLIALPVASVRPAKASTTDYLLDEAERAPVPIHLDARSERQAEAMAHFVTGIIEEESSGPERALDSYRRVLALDPGYTKLAIEVAYDCVRRGETTEAIGVLKDSIKARPDDPAPALALASIYLRNLNKPDLATRYAEAALKADPNRFAAYEALWSIAQAQHDSEAGARALDRALRAKSTDAAFWLQLAEFLMNSTETNPFEDAKLAPKVKTCLDRATRAGNADAETLARIADFYAVNHRYADAADFYKRAADLKPALANINERLAGTLIELGRKEAAIPALEKVVAGNPLNLAAYDQLYPLYDDRGDLEKALTSIQQALIIEKTNPVRQRDFIVLLLRTGKFEAAAAAAAEARRLFPKDPFFTYAQARSLAAARHSAEALDLFERTIVESQTLSPTLLSGLFYYDYACAAQQAGRTERAAKLFQKSIELDPSLADAYNALGYMWVEQKQHLDEAERLIRKALALDPGNGAYLDSLGWLHYQRGEYEQALAQLLHASKAMPEPDSVVFEHVGDTYRALKRTAEAVLSWQKAAQLDPGNKDLLTKIDSATDKMAQKPAAP